MTDFNTFDLSETLRNSLKKIDYTTPTPIQEQSIPIALQGQDILGSAQTGTGKTAAFCIPMIEMLIRSPDRNGLILTPTRELAKQVMEFVHQLLGPKSKMNTAFIIGGDPMGKQIAKLRARPRIIVGTPGRLNDHLERGTVKLNKTDFLVLDETDRMLDMGFGIQLDRIIKYLPDERQTLMFSATLPQGIVKLSNKYLHNPQRVSVGATNVIATNIKQEVIRIEQGDKYQELLTQLAERQGSVIMFIKTKHGADKMAKKLRQDGVTAEALHGDLRQNKRDKVMQNFRKDNFRVMVATDIAARGLDVPHIEHVINYDLPQVAEDYIHRMGRTARGGATGSALSFVSNQDGRKWNAIQILLDPDAKPERSYGPKKGGGKKKPAHRGKGSGKPQGRSFGKPGEKKFGEKKPFGKPYGKPKRRDDADGNNEAGEKRSRNFRDDRNDNRDGNRSRDENRDNNRSNKKRSDARTDRSQRFRDDNQNERPAAKKPRHKRRDNDGNSFGEGRNEGRGGNNGERKSFGDTKPAGKKSYGKPTGKPGSKPFKGKRPDGASSNSGNDRPRRKKSA